MQTPNSWRLKKKADRGMSYSKALEIFLVWKTAVQLSKVLWCTFWNRACCIPCNFLSLRDIILLEGSGCKSCMLHVLVSWNLYHHVTRPLLKALDWLCLFPDQKLRRDIYVEMDVTYRVQEAYNALCYFDVPKGFNCSINVHS